MSETLIITKELYLENASTLAQRCNSIGSNSAVAVSYTASNGIQGLKLMGWHSDGGNNFNDYIGSETEKAFSTSGQTVGLNIYVISGDIYSDAETLNKNTNLNVWVVDENGVKFYPKDN